MFINNNDLNTIKVLGDILTLRVKYCANMSQLNHLLTKIAKNCLDKINLLQATESVP